MLPVLKHLLVVGALLASAPARADVVLVQYAFAGLQGEEHELTPERVAPGVVAGPLVRGKGLDHVVKLPGTFAAHGWTTAGRSNDTDFFEFKAGPDDGAFTLSSLEFEEFANAKGPEFFVVRSSLDGFSSDLLGPVRRAEGVPEVKHTLRLGSAFSDLREPVTFRFVAWGAKSGGSGVWALGAVKRPSWLILSGTLKK